MAGTGGGGAARGAKPVEGGVMLACKLVKWVRGEPTLTIPGELTDMLAGDMATVCREFSEGLRPEAEAAAAADAAAEGGIGVPSAINCSLKP